MKATRTPTEIYKRICQEARVGDVINTDSVPAWWNYPMKLVFAEFRRAQRKRFPDSTRTSDVHSVLVMGIRLDGVPMVLSADAGGVVIKPFEVDKQTRKVTLCRLKGAKNGLSRKFIVTMRKAEKGAKEILGPEYEFAQILHMKIKLQSLPSWLVGWLYSERLIVCSGAVQYCLMKAWDSIAQRIPQQPLPAEPLGGLEPNAAYPDHFVNHDSFKIIAEEW